jgi:C4-dicarboxylate transporter, DctM subunit
VILAEIGQLSPPIGLLSFVVHRIAQEPGVNLGQSISLVEVFKGVLWFVLVALLIVALLILFPEIALWLPESSATK